MTLLSPPRTNESFRLSVSSLPSVVRAAVGRSLVVRRWLATVFGFRFSTVGFRLFVGGFVGSFVRSWVRSFTRGTLLLLLMLMLMPCALHFSLFIFHLLRCCGVVLMRCRAVDCFGRVLGRYDVAALRWRKACEVGTGVCCGGCKTTWCLLAC